MLLCATLFYIIDSNFVRFVINEIKINSVNCNVCKMFSIDFRTHIMSLISFCMFRIDFLTHDSPLISFCYV
jgi:hypothetical protein